MKKINLYLGDSKEILKQLADNSIDFICTDPPYQLDCLRKRWGKAKMENEKHYQEQLEKGGTVYTRSARGFMGKEWDVLPPIEVWEECLRVLKPGAFAFIMTTPRQDSLCQILMDLSQAGFCMGFSSIYWSYATGFPKANNISKFVDKQECKKELTQKLGRKPTKEEFKKAWEDYRKVIRERPTSVFKTEDGWHDSPMNNPDNTYKYTEAKSPQAKELDGSYAGFQPKPAVEIIIVAMKPLDEKSYIDQALKNGHGISWLNNCRIPYENEDKPKNMISGESKNSYQYSKQDGGGKGILYSADNKGRFPANLLVSDDVLNDGKKLTSGKCSKNTQGKSWQNTKMGGNKENAYIGDKGSYSRYFDLDKWWIERVKQLPPEVQKVFPYLIVPKASKREKNKGCENLEEKEMPHSTSMKCAKCGFRILGTGQTCNCQEKKEIRQKMKNVHPTVKPIKLMSYLITLGSREGEVVLDPFMGSGTTGISAKLLNRKFIGIEMSEEYIKIASERIKAWNKGGEIHGK